MNTKQRIVMLGVCVVMLAMKFALPPFRPWESTGDAGPAEQLVPLSAQIAIVAFTGAILLVVFREQNR